MMGHKKRFYGEILLIIPILSLLPVLTWREHCYLKLMLNADPVK